MSAILCGFIACGNSKVSSTEQAETVVEVEEVIDTVEVDTNDVVRGDAEGQGFGRCSVSGCYCKEFEGRGQTCRNCGHAYRKHY